MRHIFGLLFLTNVWYVYTGAITVNEATGEDAVDCWSGLLPCQTLEFALEAAQYNESSEILLSEGTYILPYNESLTTFINKTGFVINGEKNVTINCEDGAGLSFINTSNIELTNVAFIGCGFLHNSTSTDSTNSSNDSMKYLEFRAAIYFLFCYDVFFEGITVTDSNGTGVVFYSTYGQVIIALSNFTNNSAISGPGGGGVAVEFIYCAPGDVECNDTNKSDIPISNSEATYIFNSCHFLYNEGSTSSFSDDTFIVPHANHNVALGRGAGLSLLFKGNASHNAISVTQCTFEGNKAVWGGAMLIEFQDDSVDNTVTIDSTVISDNYCYYNACTYEGTGGGGVRVQFAGFKDTVKNNTVNFINTQFVNNQAYFGGGVSFFTFPTTSHIQPNNISFHNCTWYGNIARLGSAIDLSLWNLNATDGGSLATKPEFHNCTFDSNSIHYTNYTGVPVGVGTLYTDSVPLLFTLNNTFMNNHGSGLASLDAAVELKKGSTTNFLNNSARNGAGVVLFNKAFLKLNEHSHIRFINNSADFHGGGIYWEGIGDHQLISSRNCFIRYKDQENSNTISPSKWLAKLEFIRNKAVLSGQAIYATTLLSCVWGGQAYGALVDPKKKYQQVFCSNSSIWDYGSDDCNSTNNSIIATAPGYYANKDNETQCGESSDFNFDVVPGEPFSLDVFTLDDRLNRIPLNDVVFSYHINTAYNNFATKYTTHENTSYAGRQSEPAELYLGTIKPRIISTKVNLNFIACPTGYDINNKSGKCEFASYPFIKSRSDFKVVIQFGYWIGQTSNKNSGLYVGICLSCPWNPDYHHNNESYITIPSDPKQLDNFFCGALNRTGVTCTDCIANHGVAVNSDQYKCIDCPLEHKSYSWLLYLLFTYGPITVMLVLVIVFNISVTSGPANAFIFFAQIISTTYDVDAGGSIKYQSISPIASFLKQTYVFIYGIWNLDFLTTIDYDEWLFCLGPDINTLHVVTLKYIAALYPLLVLLIIIVLLHLYYNNNRVVVCIFRPFHKLSARCLRRLNLQRSIMDSFATFIILSYVKFVVTSSYLLYPNAIQDSNGVTVEYRSFFNANIKYNSVEYVPYLLFSLIVIILCIVLPFFLLLYSIKPCYQCLQKYHCHRLEPGIKVQHFLNSFHHCFKDGTDGEHDRRFYASIYFFLKLSIIATFALGMDWTKQYILQQFICTVALCIIGILQPYKEMWYNILDLAMFSLLCFINALTIYNRFLLATDNSLSETAFYFQSVFIFIPLVYFVCYGIYFFTQSCRRRCKRKNTNRPNFDEFSFRGFMNDVDAEDRLQRNNYYGSIETETYQQRPVEPEQHQGPLHSFPINSGRRMVSTEPAFSRHRREQYEPVH